jgi:hypothetical protein
MRDGLARDLPEVAEGRGGHRVRAQLPEKARIPPKQVHLIDGLVRIRATKVRGAVGREDQEGGFGLGRLHHRREEVGHRRP